MEQQATAVPAKPLRSRLVGEWKWEKYIPAIAGIATLVYAIVHTSGNVIALIRDEAFQTALLFFIGAYLSEMRYRLFPDVRND